jgi:hypothetical protein
MSNPRIPTKSEALQAQSALALRAYTLGEGAYAVGLRGRGLWSPLQRYAALAICAFAVGARFRTQYGAERPRNAHIAHSGPTLGVFQILCALTAPFSSSGCECAIVPRRGRCTIPDAIRGRAAQKSAHRPLAPRATSVLNSVRTYCPVPVHRLLVRLIVPSCPVARSVHDSGRNTRLDGPGTRTSPNRVPR